MANCAQARGLQDLLDELEAVADRAGGKVSVEEILGSIGRRSFGPLLLLAGLLGMTPVSAVPGAPSAIGVITVLVAGQLLFGRDSIWLPRFLLRLSVKADRVKKTVRVTQRPARAVDKMVKARLQGLTGPLADRIVALVCVFLGLAIPPLELLPFVAFIPAAAIATFGLGLIARDGLLILVAFLISGGALAAAGYQLLV